MCCVAAHEPDGRRILLVPADITGSTLRLILRLDSLHLREQRPGARASASSYRRSSWRYSPSATPKTVPVMVPVGAKKTGVPNLSNATGRFNSVKVRMPPVAFLKRPFPPVI
jgi:hypothetical protein